MLIKILQKVRAKKKNPKTILLTFEIYVFNLINRL